MDRLERLVTDEIRTLYPPPFDEEYFAELERHDKELREIPTRYVSGLQLAFQRAFNRAVAFGDFPAEEAGFYVQAQIEDLRGGQDAEIRSAMLSEHERHREIMADLDRRVASVNLS